MSCVRVRRDLPPVASLLVWQPAEQPNLHLCTQWIAEWMTEWGFIYFPGKPLYLINRYLGGTYGEELTPKWPHPPWKYPVIPSLSDPFWSQIDKILIHIPKTAGCSIRFAKLGKYKIGYFNHMEAHQFHPSLWPKMVAVVRNPYDRAVSAYTFSKEGGFGLTPAYSKRLLTELDTFPKWVKTIIEPAAFECIAEKPQVAWTRLNQNPDGSWNHIRDIVRYEFLSADVKRLLDIGYLPRINASTHLPWPEYYQDDPNPKWSDLEWAQCRGRGFTSEDTRKIIYYIYQQDFDTFGYPRDFSSTPVTNARSPLVPLVVAVN